MSAPCEYLKWDSDFFGYQVARATTTQLTTAGLAQIMAWCQQQRIEWLYFLADSDHIPTVRLAEAGGFQLVDIRMQFNYVTNNTLLTPPRSSTNIAIRPATAADIAALQQIASDSHRNTRFFSDSRLPASKASKLYAEWTALSVTTDLADIVLVADQRGEPVGYISGKLHPEVEKGDIGLVSVSAQARGIGIGSQLVHAILTWFATQHIKQVVVVTQGHNIAAQRLYQRFGFRTEIVQLWYHRWFR